MVQPGKLILIGYWDGPETDHTWPSPSCYRSLVVALAG